MNWLLIIVFVTLQWESVALFHNIYAKASTQTVYTKIASIGKQTTATVKLDGRRNWYIYVTASDGKQESVPSNIVYLPRGY